MWNVNDWFLKQHISWTLNRPRNPAGKASVLMVLFMVGLPLTAQQPSATENVIVRWVWWLTQVAFYGLGGAVTLWGVLLPVTKKVFASGRHQEQSAIGTILWGVGLLAAPSILQLGIKWFNNDADASGMLDDLYLGGLDE